jgi:O-antigen ligase
MSIDFKLKDWHIASVAIGLLGASFFGYLNEAAQIGGFACFTLLCLVLGLWKREYALYLAFLELVLGSFGYLSHLSAGGINISLRYAFFAVIMGLGIWDLITNWQLRITNNKFLIPLAIFGFTWLMGAVRGYFAGYDIGDIFFDANSYLYLLLFLPAAMWLNDEGKVKNLIKVMLAGALVLSVFTTAVFIVFAKVKNIGMLTILYKWIRDFRIGEITPLDHGGYRIFFQSQIYIPAMLFFLFMLDVGKKINFKRFTGYAIIFCLALIVSLSRSLWVGTAAGFLLFLWLLCHLKFRYKKILEFVTSSSLLFITAGLIVSLFLPRDASFLSDRFKIGESAADSRVSQLKVLLPAIQNSPIFGYGFGKTLTFKSFDPRIGGKDYTTYAFEWGYLDMILKFGVLGLAAYLYFLGAIFYRLWKKIPTRKGHLDERGDILVVWAIAALTVVAVAHIFTPYLNHPLGIGIVIAAGVVAGLDKRRES